ncbi:hypothetical protein SAMN02799616_01005 [Paenibacillus sp. UNC499MF]|nr:hypothetical protein SAMN02799616_01005 [Paenibacillus sp. UNC499MF]
MIGEQTRKKPEFKIIQAMTACKLKRLNLPGRIIGRNYSVELTDPGDCSMRAAGLFNRVNGP